MEIFIAELETRNSRPQGYGASPEEAVAALYERWKTDFAPQSGANAELPAEYRDSLDVFAAELGKGYVHGVTDTFAREVVANGREERFDAIFANSPAPKI